MKISPARTAAYDVLLRIERDGAFTSVLLPQYEEKLSGPDRGLCHEIVLGVLRRQIYLDRVIDLLTKPKMDLEVRIVLRIGILQLLFLDKIPAYSAINESVNLVQRAKKSSAKGLVNAVLRRVQKGTPTIVYADEIDRISVETSHPYWMIEKWIEEFGLAETERLAAANNTQPPTAFRFTAKSKAKRPHIGWQSGKFVDGCFLVDRIDADLLELATRGEIYFQDEASQMVASSIEIGQSLSADDKKIFLDVCAAPGGKTTLVGMRNPNAWIVAGDLHFHRVKTLRENCERQGINAAIVQYDAVDALPFADETFDAVLIDAPCSGTGTIRHNPEIRYSLKPDDFAGLGEKQLRILENSSKLLARGGRLFYSTCSVEVEENETVIDRFLALNASFDKVIPKHGIERFATGDGFCRTWPHQDDADGFFLAVLEKKL